MPMWQRWFPYVFPSVCFIGVLFALSCDGPPTLTQDEKLTQEENEKLLIYFEKT
jgi:hypothetical protein